MKSKLKITFNAPVILGFVSICFLATLVNGWTNGRSNELLFMTYHSSLRDPLTYLRFVTHVFGHAGWEHFLGNMGYVLLLGPMLEEKYHSKALMMVIGITALATGLINYIFFPHVALCGASGVVFAFILMASFTGFREGEVPLTFIIVAAIYIGQQVIQGVAVTDNVSQMAHIVGGIIGAVVGYVANRRKKRR
ncbi:MAG: rhomboid family intramembrane serine protease [Lachnospiraceae bacterium]|nr:rhomboid family intramembrane serine protease [Lachnospiraceae bacterium]